MRARKGFPVWGVIIAAALIAALVLVLERWEWPGTEQAIVPPERESPRADRAPKAKHPPDADQGRQGQRLAVLIDDIGYDLALARTLAQFAAPIGCAILPRAPHATEADALLHAAGKEILLHLPMEPLAYPAEDPGPGALFVDMDKGSLEQKLQEAFAAVPHARGVNNHMGSRFMADETGLAVVMEALSRRGLFFVDSRTTAETRGREEAARARVPFAARSLFIDHRPGYDAALETLLRETCKNQPPGDLLLIGHPHADTLKALREALPRWQREGARLIPVSALVRVPSDGR